MGHRSAVRHSLAIACLVALFGGPFAISPAYAQPAATEPAVKMSRSGICHERGTVHYQQTIYFETFESMEACRAAGGRRMGGEYANDPPAYLYRGTHPPSYYRPYVIAAVLFIAAMVAGIA